MLAFGVMAWVPNAAAISPVLSCSSVTGLSLPNTKILHATEAVKPVPHCAVVGIINERVSTQIRTTLLTGSGSGSTCLTRGLGASR